MAVKSTGESAAIWNNNARTFGRLEMLGPLFDSAKKLTQAFVQMQILKAGVPKEELKMASKSFFWKKLVYQNVLKEKKFENELYLLDKELQWGSIDYKKNLVKEPENLKEMFASAALSICVRT